MSIECCSKVQNNIDVNKFNPFTIGIFSNLSCILADDDETFWVSLVSFELPSLVWRSQVFLHWSEVLVVQLHHYMNLHLWCNLVQIAPTNRISFLKIGKEMLIEVSPRCLLKKEVPFICPCELEKELGIDTCRTCPETQPRKHGEFTRKILCSRGAGTLVQQHFFNRQVLLSKQSCNNFGCKIWKEKRYKSVSAWFLIVFLKHIRLAVSYRSVLHHGQMKPAQLQFFLPNIENFHGGFGHR